jgi:hypothetical protein
MDLSLYEVFLFVHILAAILFLGAATVSTSLFPKYATLDSVPVASAMNRVTVMYGIGSIAVPVFGLLTANQVNYMDAGWVQASLGIFVDGLTALFIYIIPQQRRILNQLKMGTATTSRELGPLRGISGIYATTWLVILFFMVTKPF